MGYPGSKLCPQCGTVAKIDAPTCTNCGHVYRTKFGPPQNMPTMGFPGVPLPGSQPPPGVNPNSVINMPPGGQQQGQPGNQGQYIHPLNLIPPGYIWKAPGSHQPWVGFLLHVLLLGGGQAYNGQWGKAMVFLASAVLMLCVFWPISVCIWPIALIDAMIVGGRLARGEAVHEWQFF